MKEIIEGEKCTKEELDETGWKHMEILSTGKEIFEKDGKTLVWDIKTEIVIMKYKTYKKRDK